ncbi:MAG TPA: hypothetical protein VE690_13865, partial [Rhodopila sp.]|nr:hypothetical protein [Rhodopila sp.]
MDSPPKRQPSARLPAAILFALLALAAAAHAAEVTDATSRTVTIPAHIARVLPAGPPAAVLL